MISESCILFIGIEISQKSLAPESSFTVNRQACGILISSKHNSLTDRGKHIGKHCKRETLLEAEVDSTRS